MSPDGGLGHLWIIGTGRLGPALGSEILHAGGVSRLTFLGRSPRPPPLPVLADARVGYLPLEEAIEAASPELVLIAVPDEAIPELATALTSSRVPPATVMHTSGALPASVLSPLSAEGWRAGSIHPLVAIPDGVESASKLRGAWFGIEGDAEAIAAGRRIVALLGGRELLIRDGEKPLYHAAAVLASNYVVALLDVAVGMLDRCGIDPTDAADALGRLAEGASADVAVMGSARALTGPLARGDIGTIRLHLDRLSGEEARLYSVLAREALRIAAGRGLPAKTVHAVEDILREAEG